MAINNEKCRGLWGQMFLQNVAKIFLFSVEFQIMHTEQHGIYTASILAVQHFRTAVLNGYSHTCVLDSLNVWKLTSEISFTMALSLVLQMITSSCILQSLLFLFTAVF